MRVKERLLRQSGLAVFDRRVIANLLGVAYPSTNPILDRLVRAGILTRLRRDRYVLNETAAARTRKIANELVKPSAISLWTALSDAGITTQAPRTVQSVTPKRPVDVAPDNLPMFQYVHLPPVLYAGIVLDGDGVFRMPPEKALLDLLYVQGGALDWSSMDLKRLNRAMLRRMAGLFPERVRLALIASPLFR
ncbi:MAG: putative transcriptional regulator, TrmB [Candidatus Peregrinibacteria bacterium Greene0416_19]|nr:MAG: putative transcriptional regulator, TrmB [Candidatus Peregrinibacteria bacterium Greene0416_19]